MKMRNKIWVLEKYINHTVSNYFRTYNFLNFEAQQLTQLLEERIIFANELHKLGYPAFF